MPSGELVLEHVSEMSSGRIKIGQDRVCVQLALMQDGASEERNRLSTAGRVLGG